MKPIVVPGLGLAENSTGELFQDPTVDIARAKAPQRSNLKSPHDSLPRVPLKRLRVNPHDRRGLVRIKERLGNKDFPSHRFTLCGQLTFDVLFCRRCIGCISLHGALIVESKDGQYQCFNDGSRIAHCPITIGAIVIPDRDSDAHVSLCDCLLAPSINYVGFKLIQRVA